MLMKYLARIPLFRLTILENCSNINMLFCGHSAKAALYMGYVTVNSHFPVMEWVDERRKGI